MTHYRVFDFETDGLLDSVTRVHVLVICDVPSGEYRTYRRNDTEDTIAEGIKWLTEDGVVAVAHNGIGFDLKVLKKLYGVTLPWQRIRDTLVLSRLVWPEVKRMDLDRLKKKANQSFPRNLIGSYSLEAWGHRLGLHKGEYRGDPALIESMGKEAAFKVRWASWNQAMEDYCVQDVAVTVKLLERCLDHGFSEESFLLETQVATIVQRQVDYGFLFDMEKAAALYAKLAARREELVAETQKVFRPRFLPAGLFTPKRDNTRQGYTEGASLTKVVLTEFNPFSRDHVALWLKKEHQWEPLEFTPEGKPKVDEAVIAKLPYPEAAPLKELFMVGKRIGQLAEGEEAWMKRVGPEGRMHGRVNTNGAVTGRMTHSGPNMGQVPASYSPWGKECRELFTVPPGKLLVGADADALELRDLAGYMARFDKGAYIQTVLSGKKEDGTDMHSVNCRALGMDPKSKPFGDRETGRDIAKTWFLCRSKGTSQGNLWNKNCVNSVDLQNGQH